MNALGRVVARGHSLKNINGFAAVHILNESGFRGCALVVRLCSAARTFSYSSL